MTATDDIPAHPLAQGFNLLTGESYEAFKADVAANGLRLPIWLFEGKVLDGRNRLRACADLGIPARFEEFVGTAAEAKAFVESVNYHRRHMTPEEVERRRQERNRRVLARHAEGVPVRKIAKEEGVPPATVQDIIKPPSVRPRTHAGQTDGSRDDDRNDNPQDDPPDDDDDQETDPYPDQYPDRPHLPADDRPKFDLVVGRLRNVLHLLHDLCESPGGRHLRRIAWDGKPLFAPATVGRKEVLVPWAMVDLIRSVDGATPGDDCGCSGGCKRCRMAGYLPADAGLLKVADIGFGDPLGDIADAWGEG